MVMLLIEAWRARLAQWRQMLNNAFWDAYCVVLVARMHAYCLNPSPFPKHGIKCLRNMPAGSHTHHAGRSPTLTDSTVHPTKLNRYLIIYQ